MQTPSPLTHRCALLIACAALLFAAACSDEAPSGNNDQTDTGTSGTNDTSVADVTDTSGGGEVTDPSDTDATNGEVSEEVSAVCGDGAISGAETCDDGNASAGDGCSASCQLEAGFICPTPGQACEPVSVCGDGALSDDEACDDGNATSGDGCNATCDQIEDGFTCPVPGERCASAQCGNGVVNVNEDCDDGAAGNTGEYNGCKANCTFAGRCGDGTTDAGFEACDAGDNPGGYGGCRVNCQREPFCGDGIITHAETCDDGNEASADGCSATTCQVESGYVCRRPGQPCVVDTCGNGTLDAGEACDDGNKLAGDGCDATCSRVEPGYLCLPDEGVCVASACGDGVIAGTETCDDGNAVSGDGCDRRCRLEDGYDCPTPGVACQPEPCGNGLRRGTEACDDGNPSGGDGCSATCQLELGYYCPTENTACLPTTCGDGLVQGLEQCDDGNPGGGDGCSATCQLEAGFACGQPGTACYASTCGDGTREGLEQCDDGNLMAGDGCDPLCRPEPIYTCEGGVCEPVCGDGVTLFPFEACDDGNLTSGDGCSSACTREEGYVCTDYTNPTPDSIQVATVFRDFRGYNELGTGDGYPGGRGHVDFERYGCSVESLNLVQPTLNANGKPVFLSNVANPANSCGTQLTSAAAFAQWYVDTPQVNRTVVQPLVLTQDLVADPAGRTYAYNSAAFFPLNNLGYGNSPSFSQNFGFTSEFRAYFQYRGGEQLNFRGDDDVWVFINGRLAVDLGGLHPPRQSSVLLSNTTDAATGQIYDARFDIFEGGVYEIAFFHAERHSEGSNFFLTLAGFLNTGTTICDILCGDGLVRGDEQCDDGNQDSGDGCSASCVIEPGYACTVDPNDPSVCEVPPCGDGTRQIPEECDDGNTTPNDGCSATCELESCGNNTVDPLEECDDGNQVNDDGCTNACRLPTCGDRIVHVQSGEECDDGNANDEDNCTTTCRRPRCGDGVVGPAEACDDGVNNGGYDSCLFDCSARGPFCGDGNVQGAFGEVCDDGINDGTYGTCNPDCSAAPRCGDGVISDAEACDDANALYGDGCDGLCQVETNYICTGTPSECIRIN